MLHPPRTIKAALLGGFVVIFAMWIASTIYFTRRLMDTQARSAAIHARHTRGQDLLFAIRGQVFLGSIYVRDALIETGQSADAERARDLLRRLQAQVDEELAQYQAIEAAGDADAWARLENELREYWQAALPVAASSDGNRREALRTLEADVIPKRDGILRLSDEIRQVMTANAAIEQQELRAVNAQSLRRTWRATTVAVTLAVTMAIASTWYVRRLETAVAAQHAEVARHREELRQLSGRLVRAQEDERRTIARELHDEIGQALTAVDVELSVAERAVGADARAAGAMHEARTVAQRALASVRDLSQLLRPSMLDDFGLPDALTWYLRTFGDRTGIRTELVQDGVDERLPIDVELCVYRAVQEALTNVARHARASVCRVFVQRLADSVVATVEDNGVGWRASTANAAPRADGLGLIGIRERALELGGTFRIDGTSGKGTRLTIELPLSART